MKKSKDYNACVSILLEAQSGNDLTPEQKKDIAVALKAIRQIGRLPHPSRVDVSRSMRVVTDALVKAFLR
jgi:hypothetical protein